VGVRNQAIALLNKEDKRLTSHDENSKGKEQATIKNKLERPEQVGPGRKEADTRTN
jgi:hypothetical protein